MLGNVLLLWLPLRRRRRRYLGFYSSCLKHEATSRVNNTPLFLTHTHTLKHTLKHTLCLSLTHTHACMHARALIQWSRKTGAGNGLTHTRAQARVQTKSNTHAHTHTHTHTCKRFCQSYPPHHHPPPLSSLYLGWDSTLRVQTYTQSTHSTHRKRESWAGWLGSVSFSLSV